MKGKLVRWTTPAELPCYGGWDFPIHPGTFDLAAVPLVDAIRAIVAERRQYFDRHGIGGREYRAADLELSDDGYFGVGERQIIRIIESAYRSHLKHIAGLDWLEVALRRADLVVWDWPEDLVWGLASGLVYSGQWARASCPTCRAEHLPGAGRVVEWSFGSELSAEGGRRYLCPVGHTLYAIMDWNS